jgi:hypothetical protein
VVVDLKHREIGSRRFEGENHPRVPSREVRLREGGTWTVGSRDSEGH